jgi:indolepyruvate ferredoxin oxidoreductase
MTAPAELVHRGPADVPNPLTDRYRARSGPVALTGVQALARLLIDQRHADAARGWRTGALVSGYRGSPLAGLDLVLQAQSDLLGGLGIRFVPAVNEELGATIVYGSQSVTQRPGSRYDGVFGLWYGKAPGVDRSADAFKHGTWMGTTPRGGVLAVAGDDPSSKSSTLPSNSVPALAEAYMPVLSPGGVGDLLWLGRHGFELSRYCGAWVGFQVVTNVADSLDVVELGAGPRIVDPGFEWNGKPWQPSRRPGVDLPAARAMEDEVLAGRLAAARAYASAHRLDRVEVAAAGARLGLVAAGRTYVELRQALNRLGLDSTALDRLGIRVLRLGMVYPLDGTALRSFAAGLDAVIVVEEKRSFIETQVKEALYALPDRPLVYGKLGPAGQPLVPVHGELDADRITGALAHLLADRLGPEHVDLRHPALRPELPRLTLTPVARTPFFCSGCPHNRSTEVPEGSRAGAGIGCHTMTTFMDRSEGVTQMGGEGVTWVGEAPFTDTPHMFQNLGDGTFFHSGSLAIRQAVAAGAAITFKLLHNSAVAMTGGQSADGAADPPAITWMMHAEGVARTVVVTDDPRRYGRRARWAPGVRVRHRDDLDAVQRELREVPGVTVLIYDQACAAETRRKRKRGMAPQPTELVVVNEAVCEGCGDCGRASNCLSVEPVETEFGRKTRIDQASCNSDLSCLRGDCPSFVVVTPRPGAAKPKPSGGPAPLAVPEPSALPEPERPERANVVLTGIGGTGVVTVNQILATAALLDGLGANGLDQTGLSQKAGSVVSHLRIHPEPAEGSGLVGAGEADAYLVFDALTGAAAANLARCAPERTAAVVSSSEVPTGRMVADPAVARPDFGAHVARIAERTTDRLAVFDAAAAAAALGAPAAANFLVVGAAYQLGLLPVSAAAIEQAIAVNGVGVAATVRAFRAGRGRVVAPPAATEATTEATTPQKAPAGPPNGTPHPLLAGSRFTGELRRLLDIRVPELVAYQNTAYAERYLATVTRAANADQRLGEAVARGLFKLIAYKDEYEVARLHLDADLSAYGAAKVKVLLHPPVLRALGIRRKLALGRSARPVFRVLRALRFLRGTPFDLFGHSLVRRTERALIGEYLDAVDQAIARFRPDRADQAVALAELPDVVRGYEQIKLDTVAEFRRRLAAAVDDLRAVAAAGIAATGTEAAGTEAEVEQGVR